MTGVVGVFVGAGIYVPFPLWCYGRDGLPTVAGSRTVPAISLQEPGDTARSLAVCSVTPSWTAHSSHDLPAMVGYI